MKSHVLTSMTWLISMSSNSEFIKRGGYASPFFFIRFGTTFLTSLYTKSIMLQFLSVGFKLNTNSNTANSAAPNSAQSIPIVSIFFLFSHIHNECNNAQHQEDGLQQIVVSIQPNAHKSWTAGYQPTLQTKDMPKPMIAKVFQFCINVWAIPSSPMVSRASKMLVPH